MTARASSAPQFGPNGAVMNGPDMTDQMRDKIARSDPRHPSKRLPKPMQWLFAGASVIALCLVSGGAALRDEQPGIAIALSLGGLVLAIVNAAWRSLVLRRLRSMP